MALINVTDDSFETDVLGADLPVLVDFWATWCGPCKQMAPALDEIAAELDGKLIVAKIDADENPDIAGQYGVRGLPTLMLFKNGELVGSPLNGAQPKSKIADFVGAAVA